MPPKPTALQDTLGTLRAGNQAALMTALQRELAVEARGRLGTRQGNENLWGQPSFFTQYGPGASQDELKEAANMVAFGAMTAPAGGSNIAKALMQTQARKMLGIAPDTPYSAPQVQQVKLGYQGGPSKIPAEPGFPYGRLKDEYIGTGEGNTTYGHGHYMAEDQGAAKTYRPDAAVRKGLEQEGELRQIAFIAQDDNLLHWDKTLSEQPKAVREALGYVASPAEAKAASKALQDVVKKRGTPATEAEKLRMRGLTMSERSNMFGTSRGENIYHSIADNAPSGTSPVDRFKAAGIKGVKYLDGGSRGADKGTFNYVMFDPKDTAILKTMGIGGAGGGLADTLENKPKP